MQSLNKIRLGRMKLVYDSTDLYNASKGKNNIITIKKCLKLASSCGYGLSPYDYRKYINVDLETNNIFKFINSYLYGSCHEIAFFLSYMLKSHGIKTKLIHLNSGKKFTHVALEVYYKSAWHFIDPTLGIFFKKNHNNEILSISEIKKNLKNKKLKSNKIVSLDKFKTNIKGHLFYYKKKKSFKNALNTYLCLFKKTETFKLNDRKFAYKKLFSKQYGLSDFTTFKEVKYFDKDFKVFKAPYTFGIVNAKRVKSNKLLKFKNYIFKKKINFYSTKINDFPFVILDIKIKFKSNKSKLKTFINSKNYQLTAKNDSWLLSKIKRNVFEKPIRSFFISSEKKIINMEVLFLKSNLNL